MTASEKAWLTVALMTVTTFAIRAFGPVTVGGVTFGPRATRVLALLPAAVLAGLVLTETILQDGELDVDARAVGVVAGLLALWRGASPILVVVLAAAVTAGLRVAI